MRIGLKTTEFQEIEPQRKDKSRAAGAASETKGHSDVERVSLRDTTAVQQLVGQAMQMPEVREEKVNSLRRSIAKGEYRPDAKASAEGLLKE